MSAATDQATSILCIETSQSVTSVAIGISGSCISLKEVLQPNQAADKLQVLVQEVLEESGLTFKNLKAVAISGGPGSYTGLRIAASAAKGYCFAGDIPLIAVPTLETMVEGAITRYHQTDSIIFVPMIDARRMEVFTGFYDKNGRQLKSFTGFILDENAKDFFEGDNHFLLFGSGAAKAYDFLHLDNIVLLDTYIPSAADLCKLANLKFENAVFEDIAYYEPDYAKPFYTTAIKQNR